MIAQTDSVTVIFFSAALVNNLVLEWQLAVCPLLAASRRLEVASRLAIFSIVCMSLATVLCYLIYYQLLVPLELNYLSLPVLLSVLVVMMQSLQNLLKARWPGINNNYGIFIPLLTLNCALPGVVLLMLATVDSMGEAIVFGIGTASGFALILILLAGLRERLELADVPRIFRGAPITLVTLGILSMALSGF